MDPRQKQLHDAIPLAIERLSPLEIRRLYLAYTVWAFQAWIRLLKHRDKLPPNSPYKSLLTNGVGDLTLVFTLFRKQLASVMRTTVTAQSINPNQLQMDTSVFVIVGNSPADLGRSLVEQQLVSTVPENIYSTASVLERLAPSVESRGYILRGKIAYPIPQYYHTRLLWLYIHKTATLPLDTSSWIVFFNLLPVLQVCPVCSQHMLEDYDAVIRVPISQMIQHADSAHLRYLATASLHQYVNDKRTQHMKHVFPPNVIDLVWRAIDPNKPQS